MQTLNEKAASLAGTYWYVPENSLLAVQIDSGTGQPVMLNDQTVWQITGYKDGYFWGNCAALLFSGSSEGQVPNSFYLLGSLLTDSSVQISFVPVNAAGAMLGTTGFGRLYQTADAAYFEMQMATGTSALTAHRAFMLPTQNGDASWNQLPGTDFSLPQFLEMAGFTV